MCLLARLWSQSPFKRLSWYDRLQGDSGGMLGFPWSSSSKWHAEGHKGIGHRKASDTGTYSPVLQRENLQGLFPFLGKPDKRDLILKIAGNQTVFGYH